MAQPVQSQPQIPGQYPTTTQPGYPPQGQPGYPPQGQPAGTHTVTVVQTPAVVYPPDHCALAWFACLCCFWPLGICAIISSNNTRDAITRGDLAAANTYSQSARKYSLWTIGIGICLIILVVIIRVALSSTSSSSSSYSN